MLLKKIGFVFCVLAAFKSNGQQIVRASGNVQIVTTAGTKTVLSGGGITFLGTSKWTGSDDSIYLYKTTATSPEGWLDSTAAGAMDVTSTGNVFFGGSFLQSFYGKTRFYDLTIRNSVGDTLLSSCEVRNILHLDTGFVFTRTGFGNDSLLVSNPATTSIVSTSNHTKSWVNGRLSRTANVTSPFYLFPVGKTDSLYAPVQMLKQNTNTATWTAEYFSGLPFDHGNVFSPPIDHISWVEYWEITGDSPSAADNNAKPSLSWRGYSRVSSSAAVRDSLIVAQYINRPPYIWDIPGGWVTGNVSGSDSLSGYVTSNTYNNFSYLERRFTLGTNSKYNGLPVKLLYFTAIADGNRVRLNWEAANEQDTRLYEVERSLNATNFVHLSTVNSRQLVQSAYADYDPAPAQGWNYYRLKIIDKSGSFFYSPIRQVKFDKGAEELKIFPNPATSVLNILLPTSYINKTTIQVYGIDGKLISSMKPSANLVVLNVEPLAAGTYLLQVINNNTGNKESLRFVKQ